MGNEEFFVVARKSKGCAEAYSGTSHKVNLKIVATMAKKDRFRMKTR